MYYTRLQVSCSPEYAEMIMAEVADAGFDTMIETENGFEAYVELEKYDKEQLAVIKGRYNQLTVVLFEEGKIEKKNWNEEWEKSYEPIIVEDRCLIKAHFHNIEKKYDYEIVITPKMSFGTGHHQTTYLMIKNQMEIDHKNKRVMDAGCGTAILSIMAEKLGAREVEAFDIDEWSIINGKENVEINNCRNVKLHQGKLSSIQLEGKFNIILANINKNVLLEEIKLYRQFLEPSGLLLLSGFYAHDIGDLLGEAEKYKLDEVSRDERENWAALLLQMKSI